MSLVVLNNCGLLSGSAVEERSLVEVELFSPGLTMWPKSQSNSKTKSSGIRE